MKHVAIDLGSRMSNVAIADARGQLLEELVVPTTLLCDWLRAQPKAHVAMETGTQSRRVSLAAREAGHVVAVVAGKDVRALGVGARGIKTDKRDAIALALASARLGGLPSTHIVRTEAHALRSLMDTRARMVRALSRVGVEVKAQMRGRLIQITGHANSPVFAARVRELATNDVEGLSPELEMMLETYEHLRGQVERLDAMLEERAKQSELAERMQAVPGVGPVVSMSFIAQVDDPARFKNADHLASYLTLSPGEASTGGKTRRTGTISTGPTWLKALFLQAAWTLIRTRPYEPIVVWARTVAERRDARVAAMALARKLATVLWSMWKHGTKYDPSLASPMRPDPVEEARARVEREARKIANRERSKQRSRERRAAERELRVAQRARAT